MYNVVIKVAPKYTAEEAVAFATTQADYRKIKIFNASLHPHYAEVHAVAKCEAQPLMDWFFEESHRPEKRYPIGTLLLYSDVPVANQNKMLGRENSRGIWNDLGGDYGLWIDGDTCRLTKGDTELWAGPLSRMQHILRQPTQSVDLSIKIHGETSPDDVCPMFNGAELEEFNDWRLTKKPVHELDDGGSGLEYGPGRNVIEIVAADSVENGAFFLMWNNSAYQSDDLEALERVLFRCAKRDGML